MQVTERRYDVDAIRVIALLFLVAYHAATFPHFYPYIRASFGIFNIWRIPIVFLVGGAAMRFLMYRRSLMELLQERAARLLVPLLFGMMVLNPLALLLSEVLKGQPHEFEYEPKPLHLWFLLFLFVNVALFGPLFYWATQRPDAACSRVAHGLVARPYLLMSLFALLMLLEGVIVNPEIYYKFGSFLPPFGEFTLHGPLVGAICFVMGFAFMIADKGFWESLRGAKFVLLMVAATLFTLRATTEQFGVPGFDGLWKPPHRLSNGLQGLEASAWMLAALGLGYAYLNIPSRALSYLALAVFPVYIVHEPLQILWAELIYPHELPGALSYLLLLFTTLASSFAAFELVRRIPQMRLVFGLRPSGLPPAGGVR